MMVIMEVMVGMMEVVEELMVVIMEGVGKIKMVMMEGEMLSLIHISEPTRRKETSRMPSSA